MDRQTRAHELRTVLPVAAALAANGRSAGLAFFVRLERELEDLERADDALERARRLIDKN